MKFYISPFLKTIAVAAIFACFGVNSMRAEGNNTFIGVTSGYSTCNESGTFGAWMAYDVSKAFRLGVGIDYVFRSQRTDAFLINLDFNFPLQITSGSKIDIYPIAGLAYTSWSYHPVEGSSDVSTRKNKIGVNLGAGAGYRVTENMKLKLDVKYCLVKHYDTTLISLGIGYAF